VTAFVRYIRFSIYTTMLVVILSICCAAGVLHSQRFELLSVQTGSMAPLFYAGDAVLVRPVTFSTIRAGDVVSYRNPQKPSVIVSHRVQSINNEAGTLITKGDNIAAADIPVAAGQLQGRVIQRIPAIGYVLNWLHQPAGLIALLYVPAALILVAEMRKIAHVFSAQSRKRYMAHI
jgi:signal peptidase I